jgi:hypothetical protein
VYAFGAYLARNYGGAALIKAMANNYAVNEASVSAALASAANPSRSTVSNFKQALSKYGEALIYSHTETATGDAAGLASFNKKAETTIEGNIYTFTGFDVTALTNADPYPGKNWVLTGPGFDKGPVIFSLAYIFAIPPNSIIIQSKPEWLNVSGPLTVTIKEYPDVEIHLLVR